MWRRWVEAAIGAHRLRVFYLYFLRTALYFSAQYFTRPTVKKYFCITILSVLALTGYAQKYYLKQYRVEKGLPSDIIKASAQDSLGYFWAATDEGLVKYDGINFISYRNATHSNYAKGLFKTRSGRLLAFGDLDLIEIKNLGDTVIFNRLCPVSRVPNDSSLTYPKLLFEDAEGTLWVSESQAVVKLDKQYRFLKRYAFDLANRSPQFLRAFSFFEDRQNVLHTVSFQGNVFRYNAQLDTFNPAELNFPANIEIVTRAQGTLVIGSSEGLYYANLVDSGGFEKPLLKIKIPFVSYFVPLQHNKYFIATRRSQHFIADLGSYTREPVPYSINNINHLYISKDNDIWISGNEGLIMMRENLFQSVNERVTDFIESITEDPVSRMVYYATAGTLFSYSRITKENKELLDIPNGHFQSLLYTSQGIWAANAFKVYLISTDGKIEREFDFTTGRKFVTALSKDKAGNIWLTIPGSSHAYRIDKTFRVNRYRVPFEKEGVINMIREGDDGMYIASAGTKNYLFFMPAADSVFKNISIPFVQTRQSEFNATDLIILNKTIWLATTEGLLKYDNGAVRLIYLGDHVAGLPVRSVHPHPDNKLLASSPYGMILYDIATGSYDLFNESSGLLSNTITPQGFFVGKYLNVWIGTAKGLCASIRPLSVLNTTPRPLIMRFTANGTDIHPHHRTNIAYGSFLSVQASSITFPENEVMLQYRVLPDSTWASSTEPELSFTARHAGTQTLEIRAKKNGPYAWSESSFMQFKIEQPFWLQLWFYLILLVAGSLLVVITTAGVNARNKYKTRELKRLVDLRTAELKQRNQDLVQLNDEKNNLIGIVAHDLKSPLRQIMGLLSLIQMTAKVDPDTAGMLTMANDSTKRLDNMIMKILDTDALDSQHVNVKLEPVNLSAMLQQVASRYYNDAAAKKIVIHLHITENVKAYADKNYAEQVIENLLSNAIKFSPFDRSIFINLTIADTKVLCEIKDQGPGLTEADKKKLFGKYQKLSARPTGSEISTGLGLSIVKKFMVAMQGEIWCESEPGQGASFFISFGLASDARQPE